MANTQDVEEVLVYLGATDADGETKAELGALMDEWDQMNADADAADAEFEKQLLAEGNK